MMRLCVSGAVLLLAASALTVTRAQTPPSAGAQLPKMRSGIGYYTETQAARGKVKFEKECTECHTVDPKKPPRVPYGGSLVTGGRAIANKRYNNRSLYPSVFY